jgi:hypothetical protein
MFTKILFHLLILFGLLMMGSFNVANISPGYIRSSFHIAYFTVPILFVILV